MGSSGRVWLVYACFRSTVPRGRSPEVNWAILGPTKLLFCLEQKRMGKGLNKGLATATHSDSFRVWGAVVVNSDASEALSRSEARHLAHWHSEDC